MKSIIRGITNITKDFDADEAAAVMTFVGFVVFMYIGVPVWMALIGAASYIIAMPYEVSVAIASPFIIAKIWKKLHDWSHNSDGELF